MILPVAQARAVIRDFLRWWGSELLGILPRWIAGLSARADRIVIQLAGDTALVLLEGPRGTTRLGAVASDGLPSSRAAMETLLRSRGLGSQSDRETLEVRLRLAAECALRTTVRLPAAAAANLNQVMEFELDRHTPFRASQAFLGTRLLNLDKAAGTLTAAVTVVPRTAVEHAIGIAVSLGLAPNQVDVAAEDAKGEASEPLSLGDLLPRQPAGGATLTWAFAVAAAVLAVIAASIPIVSSWREASALTARFAAIKEEAVARSSAQQKLDALLAEGSFVLALKQSAPTVSQLLLEITRILPDDTSLTELHVAGPDVQMAGLSSSASSLIGMLERSGMFHDTTFRSPVTQDSRSGNERFTIATRVAAPSRP